MNFYKDVWQTLSAVNVNEQTEKKGNLTYLSWAWAWGALMSHYPASTYVFDASESFPDGTLEVRCTVTVSDGENSIKRIMWLPVMDNRNNAIKNPDARKISDTKMRCLTKCISMFGLGHYIYAGEDLPVNLSPYTDDQKEKFDTLVSDKNALGYVAFIKSLSEDSYNALYNSFPSGLKVKGKEECKALEKAGFTLSVEYSEQLSSYAESGDKSGVEELSQELGDSEKAYVFNTLNAETKKAIKELMSS